MEITLYITGGVAAYLMVGVITLIILDNSAVLQDFVAGVWDILQEDIRWIIVMWLFTLPIALIAALLLLYLNAGAQATRIFVKAFTGKDLGSINFFKL